MKLVIMLYFLSVSFFLSAGTCSDRGPNVILFTWDGIRNKEFFRDVSMFQQRNIPSSQKLTGQLLPKFWTTHAKGGVVLGGMKNYKISSKVALSLPSYQSIFVGSTTNCRKNSCAAVTEETFLESIRTKLNLEKKDVAVFASWNRIVAAIAKNPENVTHSIFPKIFTDGTNDEFFEKTQQKAMEDLPRWSGSRKDQYTFQLATHYLKKHCPRVLYISLVDSDEFGHSGDYTNYALSIKTYDNYLDELLKTINSLGDYGKNTTLILTTDHSRGSGIFWRGHGHTRFTEKSVFLFASGRGVKAQGRKLSSGNHLMIRPTIEGLMGLPVTGEILPGVSLLP